MSKETRLDSIQLAIPLIQDMTPEGQEMSLMDVISLANYLETGQDPWPSIITPTPNTSGE